jgi:hypothetical protein
MMGGGGLLGANLAPSSVVTPALLFKEVELRKAKGAKTKPPALPRP